MHADMLAFGNQIFPRLTDFRRHDNFAFTFGIFAERYGAVDFADNREFLRLARFEKLGHARQTAGDILGFGRFARDFRHRIAGKNRLPFLNVDMRAHRQEIARFRGRC